MVLPDRARRSISLAIPLVTVLSLFGITESIFSIGLTENIASTGITLKFVLAVFNAILLWWIYKHRVP